MRVRGEGPIPSRIMLVGEAPGAEEERTGVPFVGASGMELNRMLQEAGIMRSECYATNVVKVRPPNNQISAFMAMKKKDIRPHHVGVGGKWVGPEIVEGIKELKAEIEMVRPNLIIALGNLSMWALTGKWGILKWRGSQLSADATNGFGGFWAEPCAYPDGRSATPKVIPTIHPAAVLRQWDFRRIVVQDLRRAKRHMASRTYDKPEWKFIIRPTLTEVVETCETLLGVAESTDLWLDFDIETKGGHIDCVAFSWSRTNAMCIPFMTRRDLGGYWNADDEAIVVHLLWRLLTHPRIRVRWQNGLYDAQYMFRHLHFIPRGAQDTMISAHTAFCALNKGLGFLASMYADWYVYWKDEGKLASSDPEEQRWAYNCQDCIYTREVGETLTQSLDSMGLGDVDAVQQALFYPVLRAMLRGVRIRTEVKAEMAAEVQAELSRRETFLYEVLGHSINVKSPKQMQALFYEDLKLQPILKRVKQADGSMRMVPTCDDEALTKIGNREPLLRPVVNAIADIRTLSKFHNDFILMPPDADGRMRCSFNIAGDAGGKSAPYSYRLSSSENPFGSGGNLQTIPSEKSKSSGKAAARGSMDFTLPNIRSMYGPDPGFTFFDGDLDRADLQVVGWESGDELLKAALRIGADIHLLNVFVLDGQDPPPLEELVEGHPRYADIRGPRKHKREFAKVFCHGTNYLGRAKTMAEHTGRSIHEVERAQRVYLGRFRGIQEWHNRVIEQVTKGRFVENRWGYRWYIFDRIDDQVMPKAVAWIPQSTIGGLINRIWLKFDTEVPEAQVLLQVHDSLAGQVPTHRRDILIPQMEQLARIPIPYDDPLIIPFSLKTSEISWGDCE